jgi:hypothetical protein
VKIVYTRPDGGLSIVTAAPKEDIERALGPLTDEAYRAHVLERSIPEDARDVRVMPDDWQPQADRSFRDAWHLDGRNVGVDMAKARDIHRDRLRRDRAERLAHLDIEAMRAIEAGGDAEAVAAEKQKLRDAPAHPAIEAVQTPEGLKALTLDFLLNGKTVG